MTLPGHLNNHNLPTILQQTKVGLIKIFLSPPVVAQGKENCEAITDSILNIK